MPPLTASEARSNLYRLIDETAVSHQPAKLGTPISRPKSSERTNPWRRQPPVFNLFIHRLQLPITPVSSNHGCDESRQTPIRIKRAAMIRRSPWRLRRPRKTLVPQRVQWVHHRPVAAGSPAPIPGWLTLRAIRVYCKSVTAARHPIQTKWLSLQSPCPGLPAAVVTHAKQRVTSNGLRSFRMWKQARASLCASALIATTLLVLAFFRS